MHPLPSRTPAAYLRNERTERVTQTSRFVRFSWSRYLWDSVANGHRAAVLLGADDCDALRETIAGLDADSLAESRAAARTDDE